MYQIRLHPTIPLAGTVENYQVQEQIWEIFDEPETSMV